MSHSSPIVPLPVCVIRTFEDEEVCADEEPSKPIILLAACICAHAISCQATR